jgi:hypothetical protein
MCECVRDVVVAVQSYAYMRQFVRKCVGMFLGSGYYP